MTHWARSYIGKAWASTGAGPLAFSCWGLVRDVFRTRHGVMVPHVAVGPLDDALFDNVRALKRAARLSGWRPVNTEQPRDDDVVVMRSRVELHCGLCVRANGRLGVLHSTHQTGVVWQPWNQAVEGMAVELWRRVE